MKNSPVNVGPIDGLLGWHLRRASIVFSPDRHTPRGVPRGLLSVLSVLSVNSGINQIALSKAIGIDAANLVPLLDKFVKQGYVERMVHPEDRRARVLSLTRAGKTQLKKMLELCNKLEVKTLHGFSSGERELLTALLKRMHMPSEPDTK